MSGGTANMDELFETAVEGGGREYLEAEAALRKGGDPAVSALQSHLKDKDGMARLIARMLHAWASGKAPQYQEALDRVDQMAGAAAATPAGNPSPTGLAYFLGENFGATVVDLFAVRLVKESGWPHWKVLGVLTYLEERGIPDAAPALVRFAAQARDPELREEALGIVAKIPEPARTQAIREEKARQQDLRRKLHPALEKMLEAEAEPEKGKK